MEVQNSKYIRAKERVVLIKKFYAKVLRGVFVIIVVGGINYYLNEWRTPWFLWVVFGISLSILLRAIKIFNLNPLFGKDWEERKVKEFMNNDRF